MFLDQLNALAETLVLGAPPTAVAHPLYGPVGQVDKRQGFIPDGMSLSSFEALCRDERRAEVDHKWLVQVKGKAFSEIRAELRAERAKFRKRYMKALRAASSDAGTITTWDGVLSARAAGQAEDYAFLKQGFTGVTNQWSNFFLASGTPAAGSYTTSPGATMNRASTGSLFLANPPSGNKYLLNFGINMLTSTGMIMLYDLLTAWGGISTTTTSTTTLTSFPALTRYTGTAAAGNMMTLEVTTALGSTASNVTVTYTNSAGTASRTTAAIAMTTSAIVKRFQPVAGGSVITLQSGDVGVRTIDSVTFSASMTGSGVVAALLYRPLVYIPNIATTTFVERSVPSMIDGILNLPVGSDSQLGCLALAQMANGDAGSLTGLYQTVYG